MKDKKKDDVISKTVKKRDTLQKEEGARHRPYTERHGSGD